MEALTKVATAIPFGGLAGKCLNRWSRVTLSSMRRVVGGGLTAQGRPRQVSRHSGDRRSISITDGHTFVRAKPNVRSWPILLKKSFVARMLSF
jgi:hypothetical protein